MWDSKTGNHFRTLYGHTSFINSLISSLCFSSDDKKIFSSSYDKTINIWDA